MNLLILIVCLVLCGCEVRIEPQEKRVADVIKRSELTNTEWHSDVKEYAIKYNVTCEYDRFVQIPKKCKYGNWDEKGETCDTIHSHYTCSDGKEFLVE